MDSWLVRKRSILALFSLFVACDAGQCQQTVYGCECLEPCPTFWTPWKNHCYRYFGEEVSWYDALNTCRLFSADTNLRGFADLVSIHSLEEHEFVYHYWQSLRQKDNRNNKPGMWIGLNDLEENGVHVWSDRSVVNYTNIDRDQSVNPSEYLYFMWDWLDSSSQPHGKWHDVADRTEWYFQFMCKMSRQRYLTPRDVY